MYLTAASAAIVAAAGLASAAPAVQKRAPEIDDGTILNYALTLEHLEDNFYREGLANFTKEDFAEAGYDSTFYDNIVKVGEDESAHVKFLSEALEGEFQLASITLPSWIGFGR